MVRIRAFLHSKKPPLIIIKYIIFAGISMMVNLGSQYLVNNSFIFRYTIYLALVVGTGLGLTVKYILDKRYIFFFVADSSMKDLKTFILYTTMGLATTGIFWGMELLFHLLVDTEIAKYWGGFLGLLIGYSIKYILDRKLVFQKMKSE